MVLNSRNSNLDIIKGLCLVGVGIFNYIDIFNSLYNRIGLSILQLYLNDIFWISLTFIFGYNYFLYKAKGKDNYPKRMFLLFLMGILNSFLYYGDILKDFALVGILLYLTKNILEKYPFQIILSLIIIEVIFLVIIKPDSANEQNIKLLYAQKGHLVGNVFKAFEQYCTSIYYNTVYHLHMMIIVYIGYISAASKELIAKFSSFILGIVVCIIITGIALLIPMFLEFVPVLFFIYTSLSSSLLILFMFKFGVNEKKENLIKNIGANTLSVYFAQNIFLLFYYMIVTTEKLFAFGLFAIMLLSLIGGMFIKNHAYVERFYRKHSA